MNIYYIGVAALAGFAVLLVILGIMRMILSHSDVDDRLHTYATKHAPFGAGEPDLPGVTDRFNSFLSERSFAGKVAADLARAGVKLTVPEYLLIKVAAVLAPFGITLLVTKQVIPAAALALVGLVLPDLWLRRRQHRRSHEFVLQLPETLTLITSGLRAGFSLQQSMLNVKKEAPEPTSSEFSRVAREVQLGVPLIEALDGLARRMKSEDLDMIISVFKIHTRVGGNLANVLETVSNTIRERVRLRRDVEVITSMQRYSAYVLAMLPVALGLILLVINPSYIMSLFAWNIFLCIPVGAFIMTVMGFLVIRKMVDIKV